MEEEQRLEGIDLSWFPFAAKKYHISDKLSDYVIFSTIICPSDIPNRNGIAFPLEELVKFTDTPSPHLVYQGWKSCPLHLEHCFPGDVRVRTNKGLKRIDKIRVGDYVLTHKLQYKKVVKVYENGVQRLRSIDAHGLLRPLRVTDNHPIWVVDRRQIVNGLSKNEYNKGIYPTQVFPHWRPASDIYELDYLVAPIKIGGNLTVSDALAYLTGVYMAEGNINPSAKAPKKAITGATLTINYNESAFRDAILECCNALGYNTTVTYYKEKGTCVIAVRNKQFGQLMRRWCGCYSYRKRMRNELREWNNHCLSLFLAGYIMGDGCTKYGRMKCATVSENLAQDLQMAFGRLGVAVSGNGGGWGAQFSPKHTRQGLLRKNKGGKPSRANGTLFAISCSLQELSESPIYQYLTGQKAKNKIPVKKWNFTKVLIFGDYMLYPVSKVETEVGEEPTYNLEVADDNSYLADGIIVHNCNENCEDAIGVIFDVSLKKMPEPYGQGRIHNVVGVCGIDRTKAPEVAEKFASGKIDTVSMGALADYFTCSICGAIIDSTHHCSHIKGTSADVNFEPVVDSFGNIHVAFLNAHNLAPIETSVVADPAWAPALSDTILQK